MCGRKALLWLFIVVNRNLYIDFYEATSTLGIFFVFLYVPVGPAAKAIYKLFCGYLCKFFWWYQITSSIATGLPVTTLGPTFSLPAIPEVMSSLQVTPKVVLMGQLCPEKAISHFSGYIWNELNAAILCCETGEEDFRRREEPRKSL